MRSRALIPWTWALLALLAAHDLTHLFDDGLDTSAGQLALVAIPQWLVVAAVMAVVLRGGRPHRPLAALALGLGAAVGLAVVHLLPFAVAPYQDLDPSPLSWALAWIPTGVGLAVAGLAARDLLATEPRGADARAL